MSPRFTLLVLITSVILGGFTLLFLPEQKSSLSIPDYATPNNRNDPLTAPVLNLKDVTLDWNVAVAHQQTNAQLSALTETLGSGICAIDVNKDGWIDLFFVGGSGHTRHYGRKSWWHREGGNRLLLNKSGAHFTDITQQAGLEASQWGMGCTVGDLDNNSWPDLIITGISSNKIYSNTGDGIFVDVTNDSGIVAEQWSTGASLADYNNDSLVDIYITNYVAFEKGARTFERNKGFVTNSVAFDATLYDPLPNKLYLNQGNFKFLDTTESSGVLDSLGRSLGAHWTDLNTDGWLDLIVINDVDSPSQVYINDKGNGFTLSKSDNSLLETPESRDLLEGDFDNDSINELLITQNGGASPILASQSTQSGEKYTDRAWESGIADRQSLYAVNWGATSGDFNNDGHVDLFIANGGLLPDIDSPFVTQSQHNELLLGLGNGTFIRDDEWQASSAPLSSRAAITADLNNDGYLEIIVTNNNDPLQIFEIVSTEKNHWVGFDLFGDNLFTDVSGAQISVRSGEVNINRTANPREGFLSSEDTRLHVGLGNTVDTIDVTIDWPDGTESLFTELATDVYYRVNKAANSISPSLAVVEKSTQFATAINGFDDHAKVELGELLLQLQAQDSEIKFSTLWETSSDSVKESLLHTFGDIWEPRYLRYVKQAMDSDSEVLNVTAIEQLKSLEMEYSIAWIIPKLRETSERTACAAAKTLQFFFEEEEAVTHRKYLSVPPLTQMLDEGLPTTAVCAANALAAAESKRAVLPLIDKAKTSPDESVRLASIRALGLIRDTRAKPALADIVNDPQNQPPSVVAESLIALQRVNDPHVEAYLDKIFETNNSQSSTRKLAPFQITNRLMENRETIVFPKRYLFEKLESLLAQVSLDEITAISNGELALEILDSIKLAELNSYQFIADQLVNNDNPNIRQNAYETLINLDDDWQKTVLPALLRKESTSLALAVLHGAGKTGEALNSDALEALGVRLKSHGPMAAQLGPVLDSLNAASARELLKMLYAKGLPEGDFRALLPICETHSSAISSAFSLLDLQQQPSLQYLYLYCHFTQDTRKVGKASRKLADRLLLKNVIESEVYTEHEKQQLLLLAAFSDPVTAETMLLNSVQRFSGTDVLRAIKVLSQQQLADKMTPFLWSLLQDEDAPLAIRFAAAKHLLPTASDDVTEYVYSKILHDATR